MPQFNLGLKPPQIEISLQPNQSYTQAYEITNNSDQTVLLTTSILPWKPIDNLGHVQHYEQKTLPVNFSLGNSDLRLGEEFILQPHQTRQLVLKINYSQPQDNDSYFTFFISQKPLNPDLLQGQNLARIGSNILLNYSNSTQESKLKINNLQTYPVIKDTFLPVKINGEIQNLGTNFSHLSGKISLIRGNVTLWQKEIYPYTVLSGHSRLIHCLNPEDNTPKQCLLESPAWPGVYQVKIESGSESLTQQFFVFPYILSISILLIFSVFYLLLKKQQKVSNS